MKNQTAIYVLIGAGVAAAGTLAYFLISDEGKEQVKGTLRDIASSIISKKTGIKQEHVRAAAEHVG